MKGEYININRVAGAYSPPPPPKFFFRQGRKGAEGAGFFFTLELDRRNRMEIYHSEAWPSEQLHAGIIRNPAGTIVWCHSMVS